MSTNENDDITRYALSFSPKMNDAVIGMAYVLEVPKAEVIRRALMLFCHAVDADKIELTMPNKTQINVILGERQACAMKPSL